MAWGHTSSKPIGRRILSPFDFGCRTFGCEKGAERHPVSGETDLHTLRVRGSFKYLSLDEPNCSQFWPDEINFVIEITASSPMSP